MHKLINKYIMEIVRNNDIQLNFDSDRTFNYVK